MKVLPQRMALTFLQAPLGAPNKTDSTKMGVIIRRLKAKRMSGLTQPTETRL